MHCNKFIKQVSFPQLRSPGVVSCKRILRMTVFHHYPNQITRIISPLLSAWSQIWICFSNYWRWAL